MNSKKPNILFAIADDASHFGIYGHSFVKTPNIDSVAKKGIIFQNAFTSNPKCAPSRASILTGRFTWELEEACNHYCVFPNKFPLFPDILEENGYFVGFTGKGWSPGDYERNGYKRNPAGNEFNCKKLVPPKESKISDCDYAENFKDFLEEKPDDSPFYFWYGCHEPHRHYSFEEGIRGGKSLDELNEIPSYFPDTIEVRKDILDYAYEIEWFDKQLGNILHILETNGELENTLVIVTSDNGCPFPRVKGQMYEQDFHLPMVASFPNATSGGRTVTDIISFTDIAPTFLELAGITPIKSLTGKSFLDIIYSNASGRINQSRNVTYFGREKHDLGRENDLGYPVRCIRTDEFLYIHNFAPERYPAGNPETYYTNCDSSPTKEEILKRHNEGDDYYYNLSFGKRPTDELYRISEDPECMNNLAYDPSYSDIKEELRASLFKKLEETNDPRLTDPNFFEKFEYTGEDNHSWKALKEGRFSRQNF